MSAKILSGAAGVLYEDRRDFYIDPQVVRELWTDVAPFTTVVSNKETRATNDPIFKMFEHKNPWVKQQFLANKGTPGTLTDSDNAVTGLPVDGIEGLGAADPSWVGLICEVWSANNATKLGKVIVTAVAANGQISVKNMGEAQLIIPDDGIFKVIGNAHGEGTEAPEAWADELSVVWNSTQIFKTPLEITGTLLQAALRGESSELARLRSQKNQEHKMQKEKAFLFGSRVGGTNLTGGDTFADGGRTDANGKKIRSTYGMVSAIEDYGSSTSTDDNQNIFTLTGTTAYTDFIQSMEKVFQYVPTAGVKRAFCGAGAMTYWNALTGTGATMSGTSGWTVNIGDMKRDTLGFNYRTLETPHGVLQLIPTPALRGNYNGYMLVVDEDNMFHAQYRSPMFQANIKTENAYDGVKDQYFSDEGIGVSLIDSHAIFKTSL